MVSRWLVYSVVCVCVLLTAFPPAFGGSAHGSWQKHPRLTALVATLEKEGEGRGRKRKSEPCVAQYTTVGHAATNATRRVNSFLGVVAEAMCIAHVTLAHRVLNSINAQSRVPPNSCHDMYCSVFFVCDFFLQKKSNSWKRIIPNTPIGDEKLACAGEGSSPLRPPTPHSWGTP